ncbi:hypothetical protein M4951_04405 [Blastopirellula sp. J2-11]|uniref:hypothetical protein n=1 Tax=Blastopirellula sp. J2-11 TaxID=2943192 RepID=UPI0021CA8212|nr:hypothetical protein [Blastopirellula sp. J2-11]UUO07553.1 hypothetical protein M4951_04405 [Blastopirellula sp. J2-11]
MNNWDQHDRITTIAVLIWILQGGRRHLFFEMQTHNEKATRFVWFLRAVYQELNRPLIAISYRSNAHRKSDRALQWLGAKWNTAKWLSPYRPELNPVERLRSTAKWGGSCHWLCADIEALKAGVLGELIERVLGRRLLESHFATGGTQVSFWRSVP